MKSFNFLALLRRTSMMTLLFIGLLTFGVWAAFFEIDQGVRTQGQIIPSGRTQIIQAADGGVLFKLAVVEGQQVKAGEVLAVLEKSRAEAGFEESRAKAAALEIALIRAQAETHMSAPNFGAMIEGSDQNFIRAQQRLFEQRKRSLDQDVASLSEGLAMAREELSMNSTLFKDGDVSQLDILRSRRQVNEIESRVAGVRNKYRQDASAEVAKLEEELSSVKSRLEERQSVLDHTELTAPVAGIVKLLRITTVGGVLRAGDELMQIAPTDDVLIIEAKVAPIDVGLLKIGLPVSVKIDAFDYSVYGSLNGELTYISPDTLTEPGASGQSQTYYRAHVALAKLQTQNPKARNILIKPGMPVTLDIRVGSRSILKYLAKPIYKAFGGALIEH